MGYLDTLIETEENVNNSADLPANNKIILIELIEKEANLNQAQQDTFLYFYTDILGTENIFDFSGVLNDNYALAQAHAETCISIFIRFTSLEADPRLNSWLQSAIRVVDCIVIHYIQEILNEEPTIQGNAGVERSRYIQINRGEIKAEKAGRIMDRLYGERNNMEHTTEPDPENPSKQILKPPNFKKIKKQIEKRFPEALESFNEAFKKHYEAN
jgi:hypothetical protein